jgi:chlorite dismutase
MPGYKSQHYVPQFYLRNFSHGEKSLCRYSLKSNRQEQRSIDSIAREFWFYGDKRVANVFENAMSRLEEQHAKIIENILENQHLIFREIIPPHTPQISSEDDRVLHNYINLLRFVLLTATRTKQAKNESQAVVNAIWKTLLAQSEKAKEKDISPEAIKRLKIVRGKADVESMLLAIELGPIFISDLEIRLLINKTNTPFITSDSPAVFVFYKFPKQRDLDPMAWQLPGSKTPSIYALAGIKNIISWQAPGLMIFLPFSQEITLWLFDRQLFTPKVEERDSVFLLKKSDVDELNRLQALNADESLFFPKLDCDKNDLSSLYQQVENRRAKRISKILKLGYARIYYDFHLSFLRIDTEAYKERATEFESGMPFLVRDRSLVKEALSP